MFLDASFVELVQSEFVDREEVGKPNDYSADSQLQQQVSTKKGDRSEAESSQSNTGEMRFEAAEAKAKEVSLGLEVER